MVDNRQSARTTRASVTPIRLSPSSGVPKLVLNFALGRRDQATTDVFIEGLRQATTPQRFQISTDGFQPYVSAITTTLSDRCDSTMRMQIRRLTRLTNAGAPPWHHFGTRQMQLRKARLPPGLSLHTSYAESAFPVQRIHFGGCGMLHSREPRTQDHSVVRRIDDCRGWDLSPLATGSAVWKFIDGAPIRLWLAPSTAPAALDTCLRDEPCRTSRWRRNPQADETSIRSPSLRAGARLEDRTGLDTFVRGVDRHLCSDRRLLRQLASPQKSDHITGLNHHRNMPGSPIMCGILRSCLNE